MNLSKREFMEAAWIKIVQRLPPNEENTLVLCYNSRTGYMVVFPASWARQYAELILQPDEVGEENGVRYRISRDIDHELSWDRQFTHWMPLFPPNGKQTWAEYQQNPTPKRKGRRS